MDARCADMVSGTSPNIGLLAISISFNSASTGMGADRRRPAEPGRADDGRDLAEEGLDLALRDEDSLADLGRSCSLTGDEMAIIMTSGADSNRVMRARAEEGRGGGLGVVGGCGVAKSRVGVYTLWNMRHNKINDSFNKRSMQTLKKNLSWIRILLLQRLLILIVQL